VSGDRDVGGGSDPVARFGGVTAGFGVGDGAVVVGVDVLVSGLQGR
jgi:hypothetical protein